MEPSNLVQTGGIIMARIGNALIDIHLAARSSIPLKTLALERAFGIKAATTMLTRISTCNI